MHAVHSRAAIEPLEARLLFAATSLPRPDHVVVLLEEDHSYSQLFNSPFFPQITAVVPRNPITQAPNLAGLEMSGASFTNARSVAHTNLTNYQAIFSGLSPKVHDPQPYSAPNIASELNAAGFSFGGYAEGLPHTGYTGRGHGDYADAHNPWIKFSNVPASQNMPFSKFPGDYSKLPTVSYVVPNEQNNMHSGQVVDADNWYQSNIARYANWTMKHNSLLIVTWDESHQGNNQIPTIFYGPMVKRGRYSERITQANILRTLEDMYGLAPTGRSASATPITDIFKTPGATTAHAAQSVKTPHPKAKTHLFSRQPIR